MIKKIITTLLIIILLFQAVFPIKINAFIEEKQVVSIPGKINNYRAEAAVEENEMTGLDLMAGILIEPTVEFITFIIDSIMSVFSGFMKQEEIQFVMVDKEEKDTLPDLGEVGATFTIENVDAYKTATGSLDKLQYPRFTYSPEEIFTGNIDLLDINFINSSNTDESWIKIRAVVSQWYQVFRMIAIIGLLSVLIYTGIRIIISSNTKDKAKYKEMIGNWFIAVVLVFSMHYIMAFILAVMEEISTLLGGLTGVIEVIGAEDINFKTNLIGLARFQMQQQHFSAKIGHLVIYTALVVYTFKFTFVYLKRVLRMAFLTVVAPLVAITYPIDKMNGEAKGFQMWLKEYIFNALLQPMHYLLYYILVSSSLTLAAKNPVYGIVALLFISQAEKLLKRIFGFGKANAGTVGGIAGAFATGAITSSLISHVRDPLHPFSAGKGSSSKSGENSSGNNSNNNIELPNDIKDDTTSTDDLLAINFRGTTSEESIVLENQNNLQGEEIRSNGSSQQLIIPTLGDFFRRYRQEIPELKEISFNDGIPYSMEEILKLLEEYQKRGVTSGNIPELSEFTYEDLQNILRNRVIANENQFADNGFLPGDMGYIDGDSRTTSQLMEEVLKLNKAGKHKEAQRLLKKVKNRMAQNEYIQANGGAQELRQRLMAQQQNIDEQRRRVTPEVLAQQPQTRLPESSRQQPQTRLLENSRQQPQTSQVENNEEQNNRRTRLRDQPVARGLTNVGKRIVKPVWDPEKDVKYNGGRLVGNILKGATGLTVGVAAAAVQAGISITDGKYNPAEGVATVAAGVVGASHISKRIGDARQVRKQDEISIKQYSEQWFNRDDIISSYNKEFPGQGKEMRRRAVNNYVLRGITEFKDQKQAMKYANQLMRERGIDAEEADKIAIATLQYKQNLIRNGNYGILFNGEKRKKYIDLQVEIYTGSASKDSVRRLHEDIIQNIRDFDRANR